MNLNSTDTLKLVTSSTSALDVVVYFKDVGPNPSPKRSQKTAITTADTTTICDAPNPGTGREVERITIRNKGAASNTVTLVDVDTATYETYEVGIGADGHLLWEPGAGFTLTTPNTLGVSNVVILQDDVANSADATYADVTGLSFDVVADATYDFRARIPYTAAAGTTGSAWGINGPAAPTAVYVRSSYPSAADTITQNAVDDYDLPAAGNGDTPAGAVALIEGQITPSDDGTVAIRFLSDVNTSAITAKAGAVLEWKRVL